VSNIISNSAAPLVLIADDLPEVIRAWESTLGEYGIAVVKATTIRELCEVFFAHEHVIDAIILDGCIPGHSVNTIGFIELVRQLDFEKPIIAASSLEKYRQRMVSWGCSHQAAKELAADLVADLLSAP
jgi:CheY-like chemotaxis protein